MNKIREIVTSWAISLNPTEEQKMVAQIRLKTCMNCEFWAENGLGIEYCKQCGCATKQKVFSPVGQNACPMNKWKV